MLFLLLEESKVKIVRVFKKVILRSSNSCVSQLVTIVYNRRKKAVFLWSKSKEVVRSPEHSDECIRTYVTKDDGPGFIRKPG